MALPSGSLLSITHLSLKGSEPALELRTSLHLELTPNSMCTRKEIFTMPHSARGCAGQRLHGPRAGTPHDSHASVYCDHFAPCLDLHLLHRCAQAFGAAILHAASKYIANLDLSALRLSLFGGDVVLRNLVLKLDVVRREFAADLPIKFERGFVRELRIRIPWLKLHSEPIEITVDIVELVASLEETEQAIDVPSTPQGSGSAPDGLRDARGFRFGHDQAEMAEASIETTREGSSRGDGWVHNLVSKSLANAVVRVRNLVIKFEHACSVATLSVREIELLSAGAQWQRAFLEPEGPSKRLRKMLQVADLTICLDRRQGDGRVEHFHQPLLDRGRFVLRIEAHLQPSARPSGAATLLFDLYCAELEMALSEEQLLLIGELADAVNALQTRKRELERRQRHEAQEASDAREATLAREAGKHDTRNTALQKREAGQAGPPQEQLQQWREAVEATAAGAQRRRAASSEDDARSEHGERGAEGAPAAIAMDPFVAGSLTGAEQASPVTRGLSAGPVIMGRRRLGSDTEQGAARATEESSRESSGGLLGRAAWWAWSLLVEDEGESGEEDVAVSPPDPAAGGDVVVQKMKDAVGGTGSWTREAGDAESGERDIDERSRPRRDDDVDGGVDGGADGTQPAVSVSTSVGSVRQVGTPCEFRSDGWSPRVDGGEGGGKPSGEGGTSGFGLFDLSAGRVVGHVAFLCQLSRLQLTLLAQPSDAAPTAPTEAEARAEAVAEAAAAEAAAEAEEAALAAAEAAAAAAAAVVQDELHRDSSHGRHGLTSPIAPSQTPALAPTPLIPPGPAAARRHDPHPTRLALLELHGCLIEAHGRSPSRLPLNQRHACDGRVEDVAIYVAHLGVRCAQSDAACAPRLCTHAEGCTAQFEALRGESSHYP